MINLLDPEQERQLRAGRLNVRLVRFFVLSLLIAVGVGSVYTAGFWLVTRDRDVAEQQQQAINQDLGADNAYTREVEGFMATLDSEVARRLGVTP